MATTAKKKQTASKKAESKSTEQQGRPLTNHDYELIRQMVPAGSVAGNVTSSAEHWFED